MHVDHAAGPCALLPPTPQLQHWRLRSGSGLQGLGRGRPLLTRQQQQLTILQRRRRPGCGSDYGHLTPMHSSRHRAGSHAGCRLPQPRMGWRGLAGCKGARQPCEHGRCLRCQRIYAQAWDEAAKQPPFDCRAWWVWLLSLPAPSQQRGDLRQPVTDAEERLRGPSVRAPGHSAAAAAPGTGPPARDCSRCSLGKLPNKDVVGVRWLLRPPPRSHQF